LGHREGSAVGASQQAVQVRVHVHPGGRRLEARCCGHGVEAGGDDGAFLRVSGKDRPDGVHDEARVRVREA
jgi:hypothetical protein